MGMCSCALSTERRLAAEPVCVTVRVWDGVTGCVDLCVCARASVCAFVCVFVRVCVRTRSFCQPLCFLPAVRRHQRRDRLPGPRHRRVVEVDEGPPQPPRQLPPQRRLACAPPSRPAPPVSEVSAGARQAQRQGLPPLPPSYPRPPSTRPSRENPSRGAASPPCASACALLACVRTLPAVDMDSGFSASEVIFAYF